MTSNDRRRTRSLRWVLGATVLAAVVWWTGTGPFVDGVRSLDLRSLALGTAIAVPTTVACAWRWRLVAGVLGVRVELGPAVAACYRAQFLNTTLPGGILGDVHRGVRHGRETGDTGRGLRAVAWERTAGQLVLVVVAALGLVLLPSPIRPPAAAGLAALAVLALGLGLAARGVTQRTGSRMGRLWPGVVLASTVALTGYVATYVVAARAVGLTTSAATLLPVVLLVLLAAGIPVNLAGWGPREGMAAWAFGAAGLGSDQGVATAVAYGVMVVVASLPGAVVALVGAERLLPGGLAHG